jgi:hypothetical protein
MKQVILPPSHYAASWKTEGVIKTIPEVNDLGRRYAELADGDRKEALLLELCQCFHPYLMKYLVMICRGHVPVIGRGDMGAPVNKDVKPFLMYFLPKGKPLDWQTMNQIVKQFHLALKATETDEIYDILMGHMVATIKGYDPTYTDKVKRLVEVLSNELSQRKQFSFADVNTHLDFDCNRYIRLLGRLGFLKAVKDGNSKRITGFVRTISWPPPAAFFGQERSAWPTTSRNGSGSSFRRVIWRMLDFINHE